MRECLAYGMIIGMSAAFLCHFGLIVKQGTVVIQEPNLAILAAEIVMLCAILTYGIVNLIKILRRG